MARIEKSVFFNAPVEEAFACIDDGSIITEVWPSMVEVKNLEQLPNGGKRYDYVFKMAGIHFRGTSEDIEWVRNRRIVGQSKTGIKATFTWMFQPEGEGTRLNLVVEYTVPIPVLGKVAEAFIVKANENDADVFLSNYKAKIES